MPVISYKRLMVASFALMIGLAGCASGGGGGERGQWGGERERKERKPDPARGGGSGRTSARIPVRRHPPASEALAHRPRPPRNTPDSGGRRSASERLR